MTEPLNPVVVPREACLNLAHEGGRCEGVPLVGERWNAFRCSTCLMDGTYAVLDQAQEVKPGHARVGRNGKLLRSWTEVDR